MKKGKKVVLIGLGVLTAGVVALGVYLGTAYIKMTNGTPDIVEKPEGFAETEVQQDTSLEIDTRTDEEYAAEQSEAEAESGTDGEDGTDTETYEEEEEAIVEKEEEEDIYQVEKIDDNVINVLLCGCDAGSETRSRSDSMIIASYNREKKTLKMVSLLRDTWVPIEGLGYNRLNASHSYGGVGCTINTINNVFHMDLQEYAEIGFDGFSQLIEKIGGVDVELYTAEAKKLGLGESDGVYHLDGEHALRYVRERHIGRADFERTERQRKVIDATLTKIKNEFDTQSLQALMTFAMKHIRTNISVNTIWTLALEIFSSDIEFESCCMPFSKTWNYATIENRSVITIDYEANEEKMKEFLYD